MSSTATLSVLQSAAGRDGGRPGAARASEGLDGGGGTVRSCLRQAHPRPAASPGSRILGRLIPWWYVTSLLLCIAVAVLAKDAASTRATAAAATLLTVSVVVSVAVLVPINNHAKT